MVICRAAPAHASLVRPSYLPTLPMEPGEPSPAPQACTPLAHQHLVGVSHAEAGLTPSSLRVSNPTPHTLRAPTTPSPSCSCGAATPTATPTKCNQLFLSCSSCPCPVLHPRPHQRFVEAGSTHRQQSPPAPAHPMQNPRSLQHETLTTESTSRPPSLFPNPPPALVPPSSLGSHSIPSHFCSSAALQLPDPTPPRANP